MARNWDELSDTYRRRLENHGIDRIEYESGANLSHARGHGLSRTQLIDEIQQYKVDMHGGKRKFNEERSRKNIERDSETGEKRSTSDLRKIAEAYRFNEDFDSLFYQLREDDLEDADKYH